MKRRKKVQLPRVTILSFSRKDLLEFLEAVNEIKFRVGDLEEIVNQLQVITFPAKRKKKEPSPATDQEIKDAIDFGRTADQHLRN